MADIRGIRLGFVVFWLFFMNCRTQDGAEMVTHVVKRMRLQERRIQMEIYLLREEFQNELALMTSSLVADHDKTLPDYLDVHNLTNAFETRVYKSLDSLKLGLGKEKIFRRDLQEQLKRVKEGHIAVEDFLENLLNKLVLKLDSITHVLSGTFDNTLINKLLNSIEATQANSKMTPKDCAELYRLGHVTNGVYSIYPESMWRPLEVYCDMETDGGGWVVFQRRVDGSEDFFRNWMDYRFGFGNLSREFWLGNEFIHRVVSTAPHELRIELEDFEQDRRFAKYMLFSVGPEEDGFRLSIEGFVGNVSDSFEHSPNHNGHKFSTKDRGSSKQCAQSYKGGFWYGNCHSVNINGLYLKGQHDSYANGVNWSGFRGQNYSLKFTEMKFRPK